MVALQNGRGMRTPRNNPPPGDAGTVAERIALLRLRDSANPTARAIALLGSQLLRWLDAQQREAEP